MASLSTSRRFTLDRMAFATSIRAPADDAAIDDDDTGRYGAIIDFPTSCSMRLRFIVGMASSGATEGEGVDYVALDDKRLVERSRTRSAEDVREFTLTLLRLRFLFDHM